MIMVSDFGFSIFISYQKNVESPCASEPTSAMRMLEPSDLPPVNP
jgi:hypothetical protein